jgi:hypothetical protein
VMVLLNVDTEVHSGWAAALMAAFEDPATGIVGCKLLYPDGTIQHAGAYLYGPRGESAHIGRFAQDDGRFDGLVDTDFVTGAAIAIRREVLEQVGLLDESFAPMYYEDVDWCYRARAAGFRVVYQSQAVVVHHESTTSTALSYWRKFALNQGRIRFLFKNLPLDRLLNEFGPAELAWVSALDRSEELMAARGAYLKTLVELPGIRAFRGSSSHEGQALAHLLTDLRAATLTSLLSMATEEGQPAQDVDVRSRAEADRTRLIEALRGNQAIQEQPFTSQVPVLGRLIVAIRDLWNSVSTKWYVRPMIHQQSAFNAQVIGYLEVLQDQIAASRRQIAEEKQLLLTQSRDVTENIRELTALANRLAELDRQSKRGH